MLEEPSGARTLRNVICSPYRVLETPDSFFVSVIATPSNDSFMPLCCSKFEVHFESSSAGGSVLDPSRRLAHAHKFEVDDEPATAAQKGRKKHA